MNTFLAERTVDQIMIAAVMIGYCQTLVIVINKAFKDHIEKYFEPL